MPQLSCMPKRLRRHGVGTTVAEALVSRTEAWRVCVARPLESING